MRPIHLEMTAFGSYAQTARVPFDALEQGLYLVTGDTGAGKTTIFDAIVFALFGQASGSDRTPDMMHCDRVSKDTDTVVTLRFAQSGKDYTVTRRIHFSKKRGGGYGDPRLDALLAEPDGRPPVEGASRVTARCEEILGLNAQQFRQIIMLAQGEFREFLRSDSDRKNEILGRLFDNSAYLWYQNLLGAARDALRVRRSAHTEELNTLMGTVFLPPEGISGEKMADYLPGNPALTDNLRALAQQEEQQLQELRALRDEAQRRLNGLNGEMGAAGEVNRQLEELKTLRALLVDLNAQRGAMAERQRSMALAETALHRALPVVEHRERAERDAWNADEKLSALRQELESREKAVGEARAALEQDAPLEEQLTELETELRRLDEQLPRYQELDARQEQLTAARDALANAGKGEKEARAALEELSEKWEQLRERLVGLEDAETEVLTRQQAVEKADAALKELDGDTGIRAEAERLLLQKSALEAKKSELISATEEARGAEERRHALYQRFLRGQAGLLAEDLRHTLETEGKAACPVCGSRLCREHISSLAILPEDTPRKADVDAAGELAEEKEHLRSSMHTQLEKLSTAWEKDREALLARAGALWEIVPAWDKLTDGTFLPAAVEQAREKSRQAAEALRAALERQKERSDIRDSLSRWEGQQEELRATLEDQSRAARESAAAVQTGESVIAELKKQLRFETAAMARAETKRLSARRDALSLRLRQRREAADAARQQRDTVWGSLRETELNEAALRRELEKARAQEEAALASLGFESANAVRAALAPMGAGDRELWLTRERQALTDYENRIGNTEERVTALTEQTRGKAYTDPEAVSLRIREAEDRLAAANEQCVRQEKALDNHTQVLAKAQAARDALSATEGAWKRLNALADLALGSTGDGGKLSFDRYVMGTVFREILEMANRRMDVMSGGRYELVHKTEADRRNAKAGLEIEVLDISTGQRRGYASLSGGETFFTSLSLALGLSDVVQNHAGGKSMDALFIDEGFGALSDDVLDKALSVLSQLTEGDRLVGIISHVDRLDECIPQKIRVKSGPGGSTLSLETA